MKECSIDTVCHFCLGQEGPLSLGSACGKTSPFCITSLPFVIRGALWRENINETQTWHWWLGRLNFIERMIQRFSWDFLLANCTSRPPFVANSDPEDSLTSMSVESLDAAPLSLDVASDEEGGKEAEEPAAKSNHLVPHHSPDKAEYLLPPPPPFPAQRSLSPSPHSSPPLHPAAESNLLAQVWYFAAQATHVPHHKVGKVARRVIIRIAKVLRSEPFSLEIVHDVVSRCHRTAAEGLLDRVLTAREKPVMTSGSAQAEEGPKRKRGGEKKSQGKERTPQNYDPFPEVQKRKESPLPPATRSSATPDRGGGVSPGGVASDDSYRSAVSDLSGEERVGGGEGVREERRPEGASSSGTSSDSKSEEKGGASGFTTGTMTLPT